MSKKYNIGKKSDMRRFAKDLENSLVDAAKGKLMSRRYDVECPRCQSKIPVPIGKSVCPYCKHEIDLNLNIQT